MSVILVNFVSTGSPFAFAASAGALLTAAAGHRRIPVGNHILSIHEHRFSACVPAAAAAGAPLIAATTEGDTQLIPAHRPLDRSPADTDIQ